MDITAATPRFGPKPTHGQAKSAQSSQNTSDSQKRRRPDKENRLRLRLILAVVERKSNHHYYNTLGLTARNKHQPVLAGDKVDVDKAV
ncbi:hypothetical protein L6452_27551 [Arctium lappa]|uniref:Uncharacterized protein n=1 Tax=Arctium lappa TaxID=4217 RepID=A0ACB8ZVG0_ARCLA|nr:hypothetical protein L6452_27551 [Arctium lappa]